MTKPPRPKRCSLYRSLNGLPMPLKPSGQTPTSSPALSSRSASAVQASVAPALRPAVPSRRAEHQVGTEHAQERRSPGARRATATAVIAASSGHSAPAWLATSSAPRRPGCSRCRSPRRGTSARRARGTRAAPRLRQLGVEAVLVDVVITFDAATEEGEGHQRKTVLHAGPRRDVQRRLGRRTGESQDLDVVTSGRVPLSALRARAAPPRSGMTTPSSPFIGRHRPAAGAGRWPVQRTQLAAGRNVTRCRNATLRRWCSGAESSRAGSSGGRCLRLVETQPNPGEHATDPRQCK